jgi:hypothetical protein
VVQGDFKNTIMIVFDKLLGKPKDWKLTEKEILLFVNGITEVSQLDNFFSRIIEKRNKPNFSAWKKIESEDYKKYLKKDTDGVWVNEDDAVDSYLDFLADLSDEEKKQFEDSLKNRPLTMLDMWDELHHLDKYQIFKNKKVKFFDWMNALDSKDYNYYYERIYNGKRLLSFEKINDVKESKIKAAFDELLKIIDNDVIRVSLSEEDKRLMSSCTNIDSLDVMVNKLQSLGGVFAECEYHYKKKEMITVHYYTFRKL